MSTFSFKKRSAKRFRKSSLVFFNCVIANFQALQVGVFTVDMAVEGVSTSENFSTFGTVVGDVTLFDVNVPYVSGHVAPREHFAAWDTKEGVHVGYCIHALGPKLSCKGQQKRGFQAI